MIDVSHIHQCPYCELRFTNVHEVRDHVIHDHPSHADAFATAAPHERRTDDHA